MKNGDVPSFFVCLPVGKLLCSPFFPFVSPALGFGPFPVHATWNHLGSLWLEERILVVSAGEVSMVYGC